MVNFKEVKDVTSADFLAAMEIYEEAFPAHERHGQQVIADRIASDAELLFVAKDEGKVGLMALVWDLKGTRFIVLDYLAVAEHMRGSGLGGEFMTFINNWCRALNKVLLFEVEHPDYGENAEQRLKRIAFYERHGAEKVPDVIYYLPDLTGGEAKEMIIMRIPKTEITLQELKLAIAEVYLHLYGLNKEHELVRRFNAQLNV